jgi:DNA repair exonuclease SbcCD ATPase subunit
LVRLDDALRDADHEIGFALAQFGAEKARPYADALASARAKVAEAFRLKQRLDDATPDSERRQREWTLQIIALCEQAEALLTEQDAAFNELRGLEVDAAATLADVRSRIAAATDRVDAARKTLTGLAKKYVASTFAPVAKNPDEAERLLETATTTADAAAPSISQAGVSSVSSTLHDAARAAQRADQLLAAVDTVADDLRRADDALKTLRTKTKADLKEAKAERDGAPDADTGGAIIRSIAAIEANLATQRKGTSDPIAELDNLGAAVAELDAALAGARNQTQRLEHARSAYAGAIVSAKSQIAHARDFIGSHSVGVEARTRLAEADRQLMLAEAADDPVEALDTVRRAMMHARDADDLAHYDATGGH